MVQESAAQLGLDRQHIGKVLHYLEEMELVLQD